VAAQSARRRDGTDGHRRGGKGADVNERDGNALAAPSSARRPNCPTDVTDEASGKAAVDRAQSAFGALHGMVNCAGVVHGEKILGKEGPHNLASFARTININLIGSFNMARLAADAMSRNAPNAGGERGVIVFTASVAAYDGQVGQAAYSASKSGLVGMTFCRSRASWRATVHSRRHHRSGPVRDADDGQPRRRKCRSRGQDGAVPAAIGLRRRNMRRWWRRSCATKMLARRSV
jgi:NAD(P)-dependent dehydrogenase (short-subunit alcohol dehydrogenase family)